MGSERKEASTVWAHRDCGVTQWPMPGITMVVELDSVVAAYFAHIGDVFASNEPEITSEGMLLVVTSLIDADAPGTSHTAQSSVSKGSWGAWDRTVGG